MGRTRWTWRAIAVGGIALVATACHQNGTVFAVDTTVDTVDANPGDGICADAGGDCSLRAAVMEANAFPGVEEIRLVDDESYALAPIDDFAADDDLAVIGDLDITDGVVVTGNASITAPGRVRHVFHVVNAPGVVEFDGPGFAGAGGAVLVDGDSRVVITGSLIANKGLIINSGSVWVYASTIGVNNGGGQIVAYDGRVHIENTTIWSNFEAIFVADADVTVLHSTIRGDLHGPVAPQTGSLMAQSSILQSRCSGAITSLGNNLAPTACGFPAASDQALPLYPGIGHRLIDFGDGVPTFRVDRSSLAVDAADAENCTLGDLDIRGTTRPGGAACDVGALEVNVGDCDLLVPGADLSFCDFRDRDLSGLNLAGITAVGAILDRADFSDTNLRGADLAGASTLETVFDRADLTDARLEGAVGGWYGDGADFTRANLRATGARSAIGANFTDVDGAGFGTWAFTASITGANFEGADFPTGSFWGVTSGGITGTPRSMPPGTGLVNGYVIARGVDLSYADFPGVDFSEMSIRDVNGTGTNFTDAILTLSVSNTRFQNGILDGADLSETYGWYARFLGTSMVATDLSSGDFYASTWTGATVVGSDLTDANLIHASFSDAFLLWNTWLNTTCPSGVNSDDNGGNCDGQFSEGAPLQGAPIPEAFAGMSAADFAPAAAAD